MAGLLAGQPRRSPVGRAMLTDSGPLSREVRLPLNGCWSREIVYDIVTESSLPCVVDIPETSSARHSGLTRQSVAIMSREHSLTSSHGTPAWEVAHLFPHQGRWTETKFFELHSNRMVELADGFLEILPAPTWLHQLMVKFLTRSAEQAIGHKGVVLYAPLPIRLFVDTICEPDVMYFAPGSKPADPHRVNARLESAIPQLVGADFSSGRPRRCRASRCLFRSSPFRPERGRCSSAE